MPKKLTTFEFIQRAKELHNNKYDYSLVDYKNNKTKIKIICPIHGVFEQYACHHLKGCGCVSCSPEKISNIKKKSTEEFIKEAKEIHGDKYDYSLVDYKGCQTKVKIICPTHGVFEQQPTAHVNQEQGCPFCNKSHGEKAIQDWLEKNGYILNETYFREYKFNDCKDKKPLPFDFYIPSKNILIEYQGEQHYLPKEKFGGILGFTKIQEHDKIKKSYAEEHFNFLEITYKDFSKIEKILNENIGAYL